MPLKRREIEGRGGERQINQDRGGVQQKENVLLILYLEKKSTAVVILINLTMPKECATTAIIVVGETKSPGSANTLNYTQRVCAKIATSTTTTERRESNLGKTRHQKVTLRQ